MFVGSLSERRKYILPSVMTSWWMNKADFFVYFRQMP
jgi:hypothetical protein